MRAALLLVGLLTACAPDIVSDSYLCGPNKSCPEDQVCNGADNHCVLPSSAQPFSCTPQVMTEPDDTSALAHAAPQLSCPSVPYVDNNCMLENDAEDWVKFDAPATCTTVAAEVRVSFPLAYERLGFELWDLGTMTKLADDIACTTSGEAGEEIRCMTVTLVPGTTYGIKVHPAGDGNCDGTCSYNRYKLSLQLTTPN